MGNVAINTHAVDIQDQFALKLVTGSAVWQAMQAATQQSLLMSHD